MKYGDFEKCGISVVIGMTLGMIYKGCQISSYYFLIPKTDKVQQGYVIPKKLEIILDDKDKNGEPEFHFNYPCGSIDSSSYVLTDENGQLVLRKYEINFPKIMLKK